MTCVRTFLSWKTNIVFGRELLKPSELINQHGTWVFQSGLPILTLFLIPFVELIPSLVFSVGGLVLCSMPIVQHHNLSQPYPKLHHTVLDTTFCGINHLASAPHASIHQYLGIKYASIPARFRQSKLFSTYPAITLAFKHGYENRLCTAVTHTHLVILVGQSARSPKNARSPRKYFSALTMQISPPRLSSTMNLNVSI